MTAVASPRRTEIVDAAYQYVLEHGLAGASLRPVAEAVGSSTGVLRFLFGSKAGLVKAVLERARHDELAMLAAVRDEGAADLAVIVARLWSWLSSPDHRPLLVLWVESYAASLLDTDGPWATFARGTVEDWLGLLGQAQSARVRNTLAGRAERTALLALLRGALLDLLATGDRKRTTAAVMGHLDRWR
ncbi:MAG: TetR family transcriptional regulator [Pseudonocardiales bacterium]|nr:MAG: TetR family transcriptional regulator [Pseudonocardiales bacterium]